ncbi:CPBP family intramembrane glutamic endopeptidase [Tenacibaculum maritimum]|uniref:CAAX prenyl protease 2/Lysostaphin resistance protein A-like domain-containing protein n=2 Tax=Tenacibaculum maritimum TaxID=107401 RepID=A0A2H1E9P6_9FLAO|nr:CPBP family intramembrane glutamic endopeptidase [Tenacibaculum maritimum]MCD9562440.1 CPBP family intramembrane metalloprotease [Tenacibaculum maritimum]MCD9564484.1 CPBP family intramembrane metalloprotease [Tenacibaculum maritimum]MCD9578165.1 CPBP family intramembrane metalloprotease [Tenacibaculum maritimum]MCD9584387.1 CPBP family intramembrane metalloprotease [Tenacibaculum maritimum]MCD9595560.1 CPBP family intramembrane metalloprotease [Tenacibaculum maritimum]
MNYIQQAYKGNNQWYHYAITILIVLLGWQVIGIIPLLVTAVMHSSDIGEFYKGMASGFTNLGINNNLLLCLMILMFGCGLLALVLALKYIHKRPLKTLITSRDKIDWKRFWFAFFIWGMVACILTGTSILMFPEEYIWNFKPVPFFTLVAISFICLPIQTSFEELFIRGYLLQGIGTWVQNRWFPLIFTAVFFGLLHFANPEVEKLGNIAMVFYIGTGLFYGITMLMDEGAELALGLHAINNIMAAFLVTTNWTVFQTDALYIETSEPSAGMETLLPVGVLYPLLLLIFSKKYQWKNWKEKLLGKVEKPVQLKENYRVL